MSKLNKNITSNLNYSGVFFELACQKFIEGYKPFKKVTDLGVSQVPFTHVYNGITPINGVIDFLCCYDLAGHPLTYFFVECKKCDPSKKNWIFFKRFEKEDRVSSIFFRMANEPVPSFKIEHPQFDNLIYDRGYEAIDSAKTQSFSAQKKDIIYDAAIQANTGLRSFIYNDNKFKKIKNENPPDLSTVLFIPVVFTTANLYACNVDHSDINIIDGKANEEKVEYDEKPWVEYSVPIPEYLQVGGIERSSTYIVNSKHLKDFFDKIMDNLRLKKYK